MFFCPFLLVIICDLSILWANFLFLCKTFLFLKLNLYLLTKSLYFIVKSLHSDKMSISYLDNNYLNFHVMT
jgi:hypothetical protein